jgi:glycosyltransferase involved in cell wall biosynthesis
MRRSTVGLDPMPDRYDFRVHINNKAIEYLSAGLPVISSPGHGTLRDLLKGEDCGASYETGDAGALAKILAEFAADRAGAARMAENAARLFEEQFQAERVYMGLYEHLQWVAEAAPRARAAAGSSAVDRVIRKPLEGPPLRN